MKRKFLVPALAAALLLSGCAQTDNINREIPAQAVTEPEIPAAQSTVEAEDSGLSRFLTWGELLEQADGMFSVRDFEAEYDEKTAVSISLTGDSAQCDSDSVSIDGGVITLSREGTYILSGQLDEGMLIVDADKSEKLQLVLDGATIHSSSSAAIYIRQADKVFITLAMDSENSLSSGEAFIAIDENNIDATIFSRDDLTINGPGSLVISSPAGHGVVSKDELCLTDGDIEINAASHGLSGKDGVAIAQTELNIHSGKDGIHAENDDDELSGIVYIRSGAIIVDSQGDAVSSQAGLLIEDGSLNIVSGGGSSQAQSHSGGAALPQGGGFGGRPGMNGDRGQAPMAQRPEDLEPSQMPELLEKMDGSNGGKEGRMERPGMDGGHGGMERPENMEPPEGMEIPGDMEPENLPRPGGYGDIGAEEQTDTESCKGLKTQGILLILGGSFTIDSADDAVHSDYMMDIRGGSFDISTGDDGFHADESLDFGGGSANITESYEGLEALHLCISGGEINIVSSDDGLNAAGGNDQSGFGGFSRDGFREETDGSITIDGGVISIVAYGDGIDANGSLEISGAEVSISVPTWGDTAILDYATTASITGGSFYGAGSAGMVLGFNQSGQPVIALDVGQQSAGTEISLSNVRGEKLLSYTPELDFKYIILSTPELKSGETYSLGLGGDATSVTAG